MVVVARPIESASMKATIVFHKIRQAINATAPDGGRKYRYIILRGSSRSSKTASIIQVYDLYSRENEGKRLSVWRDTKKDCKDTVLKDMQKYFRMWPKVRGRSFNKTESVYTYSTESTIEICGTDDEEKVHGFNGDVLWLNEPYKISKDTFDQLDQRTAEVVLIDYNPKKEHFVEDLMKDSRAIVIDSTFRDNPFCPPEEKRKILSYQPVSRCAIVEQKLLTENKAKVYDLVDNPSGFPDKMVRELRRCRENEDKKSADGFKWDVYGLGQKGERPNRIFRFTEISDEEYKKLDVPVYYGVDWGSVDPWAIVEVKYNDGALYLHERNYESENEIRAGLNSTEQAQVNGAEEGLVTWMFRKLGIGQDQDIICDRNRPTKISALLSVGYQAWKASKKPGSIKDGIDLLNNMHVYYTRSSENIAFEQENYSRKVDRYGIVLEEPEDIHNHCFIGSTLVATNKGSKRIDNINAGDYVLTSKGYKQVLHKFNNGLRPVSEYWIECGTLCLSLVCTDSHKIKTDTGWQPISELKPGQSIYLNSSMEVKNTDYIPASDISQGGQSECMSLSGKRKIVGVCRKAIMFITRIKTRSITRRRILSCKRRTNTSRNICGSDMPIIRSGQRTSAKKECWQHPNGTKAKRAKSGIASMLMSSLKTGNSAITSASNAAAALRVGLYPQGMPNSAQTTANPNGEGFPALTISHVSVASAIRNLSSTGIPECGHAAKVVVTNCYRRPKPSEQVYDIMVDEVHEYFANNVLVHNCMDALRYVALYLRSLGVINKI